CKTKQRTSRWSSADAETNVADGLAAEALLEFSQDLGLGNLFELVMQCWLEHPHVENAFAQRHRRGVRRDEFTDDFRPSIDYFRFAEALAKSQALHQFRE